MTRRDVIAAVAEAAAGSGIHRVGVDGPDAAGKTTLANELAAALCAEGRAVLRLCLDDFALPAAVRYARGHESPLGYYEAGFDYRAARVAVERAPAGTLVLFDGVFLLRPELRDVWDLHVFVSTRPEEALRRARVRDVERFGTPEAVERRYRRRYLPAQALYDAAEHPAERADFVIENDDPAAPRVIAGDRG